MSPLRPSVAIVVLCCGCAPDIDPPWLLTRPTEMALDVEVVGQGPYGERLQPQARTPRDALPLDTVALRPVVVGPEGRIDPAQLDAIWVYCNRLTDCFAAGVGMDLAALERCDEVPLLAEQACRFAEGGTTTLTLGDLPTELPTTIDLLTAPLVSVVMGPPGGTSAEDCVARYDAREPMGDCLMMSRALGVGPLGELVDQLIALGADPAIGEDAQQTLLAQNRNRNPLVETFYLVSGGIRQEVPMGSTVTVSGSGEIVMGVVIDEEDLDAYEADIFGEPLTFEDSISAQWWFDEEIDLEPLAERDLELRWRPQGVKRLRANVVLRDNRGGEGWGWLDIEVAG